MGVEEAEGLALPGRATVVDGHRVHAGDRLRRQSPRHFGRGASGPRDAHERRRVQPRAQHAARAAIADGGDAMRVLECTRGRAIDAEVVDGVAAQVERGADREGASVLGAHDVRPRRRRQRLDERMVEPRREHRPREQRLDGAPERHVVELAREPLPPLPHEIRVRQRAMALLDAQAVMRRERIEVVVREVRAQLAREHDGAQHRRLERDPGALELRAHERVVEARVVRHEQPAVEAAAQVDGDLGERRRVAGALAPALEERRPALDAAFLDGDDADLRDAIRGGAQARGLDVDERQAVGGVHPFIIERKFDGIGYGRRRRRNGARPVMGSDPISGGVI